MINRNEAKASLLSLPVDLLKLMIGLLDPKDFRLSRINKLFHRLFHEPWYDLHWQALTKQIWRNKAGDKAINGWNRRYQFLGFMHRLRNDKQFRLFRYVRTCDQVSALMLDLNQEDIVGRSEILIESHVNKLKYLLDRFYQCSIQEYFKDHSYDYSKFYQLHYAVFCYQSSGHIEELLALGHKVDNASFQGHTALHIAASSGQIKKLETLIRYKADVNYYSRQGDTPLSRATSHGHYDCAQALLAAGSSFNIELSGITPFQRAFQEISSTSISDKFCKIINDSYVDMSLPAHQRLFLLSCQTGRTNLVCAMINKNISLSFTIEADTQIIYKQFEALGRKAEVGALLGNDGLWYQSTMPGFTALDLAIIFNHAEIVKMLASRMSYHNLNDLLNKPHLNGRMSTFQMAHAINDQDVLHYLQITFEQKHTKYLTPC